MIAIDTEATYHKKVRDIASLGVAQYIRHPDTDHYLCSIVGEGISFVGHPSEAPWELIAGKDVCAHNASYDRAVLERYREMGYPVPSDLRWHCTADLTAYQQCGRALDKAGRGLLGVSVDKTVRSDMNKKRWEDLNPAQQDAVREYALKDSEICLRLWEERSDRWPLHERAASAHTHMMVNRGIGVDSTLLSEYHDKLVVIKAAAARSIPWAGELNAKGKEIPVTSTLELNKHCARLGIDAPTSTDAKSEEFDLWAERYGDQVEFVRDMQRWRRANRLLRIVESMQTRSINDRLVYGLKYFGAIHTGRWAGDTGLNLQNLPREAFEGVFIRNCLVPRAGHSFIIADLSQIEARVALWLAGDEATLAMIRQGFSIYEAHARQTMGYTGASPMKKHDPKGYALAKARVLALGYGGGWQTFIIMARQYTGLVLSPAESKRTVDSYRATNTRIVGLWNKLGRGLKSSLRESSKHFAMELPSGRTINYWGISEIDRSMKCRVEIGGPHRYIYGGKCAENLCQGVARDIFASAVVRLEQAGLPVVLHVHDEAVMEVPTGDVAEAHYAAETILTSPPEWASGLPVGCESTVTTRYEK